MTASENFEQVLAAAQAGGSLHRAWKMFVNTRFFVALLAPDGAQPILISEVRERVDGGADGSLAALSGAEVVRLVPDGRAIAVVLSDRTFEIAADQVAWLRKSIDAALAKAAQERDAAVPAPVPAAVPAAATRDATPEAESMRVHAHAAQPVQRKPEPSPFALSMKGRAGRMRVLACSLPLIVALGLLSVYGLRYLSQYEWLALAPVVAAGFLTMYWMIRLMVLRLHDVNLSGFWLAGVFLLILMGGLVDGGRSLELMAIIFWLGAAIVCCLIPGTEGANKYGPAPGPNSTLVKAGASAFILACLISQGSILVLREQASRARATPQPARAPDAATWQAAPAGPLWTSPERGMTIAFPVKPDEDTVRADVLLRMGAVRMRQFSAFAHSETYRVQVLGLGAAPFDPDTVMRRVQANLLGDGDVMTAPPTELMINGYVGRDIRAAQRLIRIVVVRTTVYIVTVDADPAPASMARAGAFIESLVLTR